MSDAQTKEYCLNLNLPSILLIVTALTGHGAGVTKTAPIMGDNVGTVGLSVMDVTI